MKYKVLLTGNNTSTINDFFMRFSDQFECMTSSTRFEDLVCHVKYFSPDVFLYCMHNETRDTMMQMMSIKHDNLKRRIPFFTVGFQEEIDDFNRMAVGTSNVDLVKPITIVQIGDKISSYLKQHAIDPQDPPTEEALPSPVPKADDSQTLFEELDAMFSTESAPVSGHRHVLVIDDDSRMLKTIKRDLEGMYDVATAISGKVALKFLETKTTDLILLDYEMPQQNGPEVLELLRQNPKTAKIPVIFLTGVNDRAKIQNALSLKPQGYLLKPIDRSKLYDAIQNAIK